MVKRACLVFCASFVLLFLGGLVLVALVSQGFVPNEQEAQRALDQSWIYVLSPALILASIYSWLAITPGSILYRLRERNRSANEPLSLAEMPATDPPAPAPPVRGTPRWAAVWDLTMKEGKEAAGVLAIVEFVVLGLIYFNSENRGQKSLAPNADHQAQPIEQGAPPPFRPSRDCEFCENGQRPCTNPGCDRGQCLSNIMNEAGEYDSYVCPTCSGDGLVKCRFCGGSGWRFD